VRFEDQTAQPLSFKEERILTLFAGGRRRPEIARIMGLSSNTVGHLLTSAKEKLAARTLPHAVALLCSQNGGRLPA